MSLPGRIFLHTPGPTNVPDRVLRAMHRACEDFAAPEFTETARGCLRDLARLFGTPGECFAFTANGHGAWEIPLVNLLEPGDHVLVPLAGRFSAAWAEMAERLGLEVHTTPASLERAIDANDVERVLRADDRRQIKAVLCVHTETASGARTDLEAVRAAIDAVGHPALLIVDAIASLAIEPFSMERMRIDCAITASQKGLMMPPGLAFVALSPDAMRIAERCTHPRRYWDPAIPTWRPELYVVPRHPAPATDMGAATRRTRHARGRRPGRCDRPACEAGGCHACGGRTLVGRPEASVFSAGMLQNGPMR